MFVNLACRCGKRLKVPVSAAGKRAKCPGCGLVFIIPKVPAKKAAASAQPSQRTSGLPRGNDGRPPKCTVCDYRVEEIEYSKTPILHCETCFFYFAPYDSMLKVIRNPERAPDQKLAVKLKLLINSRHATQTAETSAKKCYACKEALKIYHYYRVPSLNIEVCPKGCGVLAAISNFKKMQALETMKVDFGGELPFPKLP